MRASNSIGGTQPYIFPGNSSPIPNSSKQTVGEIWEGAVGASKNENRKIGSPEYIDAGNAAESGSSLRAMKTSLIESAEQLLNDLGNYQKILSNPAVPLKDMASLVLDMERKNRKLASQLDSAEMDEGLKDILGQVVNASSVEIIRFNRGQYENQ